MIFSSFLWAPPCLALLLVLCFRFFNQLRASRNSFPSPPSEPIIGHLRVFPQEHPWLVFTKWRKELGDIIGLSILGKSIIILNDAQAAHNILEQRSSNYSDRPRFVLQGEIGGMEYLTSFAHYGEDFRILRRCTNQFFNSRNYESLCPLVAEQVEILLKNLLYEPKKFDHHIDRMAAGALVKKTYGIDILSSEDVYANLASEAKKAILSLGVMGLTPVDLLPALRYVPMWFPGMGWLELKRARKARILVDRMINEPYEQVKSQRATDACRDSMVDILLREHEKTGKVDVKRELLIKSAAAHIYGAGVETSADTFRTFILMMTHHPEVVKKAQTEIDEVIGSSQLPTLQDRPNLPYIDCIVKEVMRINPAVPLGVPHASLEKDTYKEKIIPAGSIIFANIWAMTHDERFFPEPDRFNPGRFLSNITTPDNEKVHQLNTFRPDDPANLIFGFGRRICPGRFIADASAWLVMANMLAVFDFLLPLDTTTGREYMPEFKCGKGMTSKILPFQTRIVPRSPGHAQTIKQD